jgi:exopolyphosphatase / guanosine-5'-triphosphate,3'-diphosphate pyrophosphatase
MKLAVIDCGTNTFNLLIVELGGNSEYKKVFHNRTPVKLGEGTVNDNHIGDKPYKRGIETFGLFKEKMNELGVDHVLAFATSAIRDGDNGPQFVKEISDKYGIHIEVIDGDREAELIYYGIRKAVKLSGDVSLIMDIGGGSTEFILAGNRNILWKQSFNIGAARLLARFKPSDKITALEIKNIEEYLEEQLGPLTAAVEQYRPVELIGSSGAFESFIEMVHGELGGREFDPDITEYELPLEDYFRIAQMVINSNSVQRQNLRGLVPMRFDMIVICCLMVNFVLRKYGLPKMRISTYSLKEGAMLDFIHKQKAR